VRRSFAIFFLSLLIFRSLGYVCLSLFSHCAIDRKVSELIETHISQMGGSLIFTVPVEAGSVASPEYTAVDGKVTFEGVEYRMVKQKTFGKLLYVVCIRDERSALTVQINEIIAKATGQPLKAGDSLLGKVIDSLMKYCSPFARGAEEWCSGWGRTISAVVLKSLYSFTFVRSLFHPPAIG